MMNKLKINALVAQILTSPAFANRILGTAEMRRAAIAEMNWDETEEAATIAALLNIHANNVDTFIAACDGLIEQPVP